MNDCVPGQREQQGGPPTGIARPTNSPSARTRSAVSGPAASCATRHVERGRSDALLPQSHIEWTDENASIYAHAIRNDLGDLSLYEWWLTSSGPLLRPRTRVRAKDPSPRGWPRRSCRTAPTSRPHREGVPDSRVDMCPAYRGELVRYQDALDAAAANANETGTLLLQKPNAGRVLARIPGYCSAYLRADSPAARRLHGETDERARVTFENDGRGDLRRTSARWSPRAVWTLRTRRGRSPSSAGGRSTLVDPGGAEVEVTRAVDTETGEQLAGLVSGRFQDRLRRATAQEGFDLYVMNADGTERRRRSPTSRATSSRPAWSPDGRPDRLRLRRLRPTTRLSHRDLASSTRTVRGGRELRDATERAVVETPTWSPDGTSDRIHASSQTGCRSRTSWTPTAATRS